MEELTPEQLLADLKSKADMLNVTYSPNIGYTALLKKVQEAQGPSEPATSNSVSDAVDAVLEARAKLTALVRCVITCNDPAMKEWEATPFYSVANDLVTLDRQSFPLNVEWHVPKGLFDMMDDMMCNISVKGKDAKNRTITIRKPIKKYNLAVLPPLTEEELAQLKQAQIMRDGL